MREIVDPPANDGQEADSAEMLAGKCTDCHDPESTAQCCTCHGTGKFLDEQDCITLPLTVTATNGSARPVNICQNWKY